MARPRTVRTSNPHSIRKHLVPLQRLRFTALRKFYAAIASKKILKIIMEDDYFFSVILNLSLQEYGVTARQLARKINISEAAVGRWARMFNLPAPYVRPSILSRIVEIVHKHITDELQREKVSRKKGKPYLLRGRVS